MGKRRKSREIAIQVLYQLEMNDIAAKNAIKSFWDTYQPLDDLKEFTNQIIYGVIKHRKRIDQIIAKTSDHWSLDRIAHVDRNILRAGIFEMLYCSDIPVKVTIDEAVELAKKFGTEHSSSFINGVLDKVAHQYSKKKSLVKQ